MTGWFAAGRHGRGGGRARLVVLLAALAVAPASHAAGDRWIRLGDAAVWARPCRIGDETRPAASCGGPSVARLDVALPERGDGDRVEIAAALRPGSGADAAIGPTRVRASLATADGARITTLWEHTLDPGRDDDGGWHSTVASLPAPPDDARALVLESVADGDAPAAPIAWARPILRRHGATSAVPGVTVVVLDGLRPDRVADDGAVPTSMPILGRIARAGIVFTRAWAPTPDLRAAHVSMLTGRHPCAEGGLPAGATVGSQLQAGGWTTAVVGDDAALAQVGGFDRAWTLGPGGLADAVRLADRWLGEIDGVPFLLVLQSRQLGRPDLLPPARRVPAEADASTSPADGERARYDASVAWTDEVLGGLLGALTRRRLVGRAALVVTAGAGFALGEHGRIGMARTVYAESLHVPLVVHHPATGRERHVPFPVELRDLPRTILDLADVRPDATTPGESLLPAMRGATPEPRYVLGERLGPPRTTAARTARFSWLLRGDRLALYDLAADPTEQTDVAGDRPRVAADGRERIRAFRARCVPDR